MKYYYAKGETYPGVYSPHMWGVYGPHMRGYSAPIYYGGILLTVCSFPFLLPSTLHRLTPPALQHRNHKHRHRLYQHPPNVGIAIRTMISAPFPVDVSTGSSAISVVAVVIAAGRTRFNPASTTASRISCRVLGSRSRKT